MIDKDKIDFEVENLDIKIGKKEQKSYETPSLINLGKMQRVTLNSKQGSSADVGSFDDPTKP